MNVWIIYDSKFGNNKRIAESLSEYFKEDNNVQVYNAKKISPNTVATQGIDIFLFEGPLRAGKISFTMKHWTNHLANILKKQNKRVEKVAVWGSHVKNGPETPPKFSWEASKQQWKAVLDAFPAEKKLDEVIGFEVNPKTLAGPLEPGWEDIVKELADKIKTL